MFFNFPLITAIFAMFLAQLIKLPINYIINREYTPSIILSTGGMPSSHSAFVTALAIAIGIQDGVFSSYFAIAFVLAGVVIHDASGIRREAGKHATVLNRMSEDIEYLIKAVTDHDKEVYNEKLKVLLGHEPIETFFGVLFGAFIAIACYFLKISL